MLLVSQCSAMFLQETLESKIRPKKNNEQTEVIRNNHFAHFLSLPPSCYFNRQFAQDVASRFDHEAMVFRLREAVVIPFVMEEFSTILGLQPISLPVDENRKMASMALQRLFGASGAKLNNVCSSSVVRWPSP